MFKCLMTSNDKCVVTSKTEKELLQSPFEQMVLGFFKQEHAPQGTHYTVIRGTVCEYLQ